MEKEKITFGNGIQLSYDSIGMQNGRLVIGFVGGDAAALEQTVRSAGQDNLEEIVQADAAGNVQATHERYDIFEAINKRIDAGKLDSGETADIVEIVLAQEGKVDMEIRHLKAGMGALQEVTDAMLMDQLA